MSIMFVLWLANIVICSVIGEMLELVGLWEFGKPVKGMNLVLVWSISVGVWLCVLPVLLTKLLPTTLRQAVLVTLLTGLILSIPTVGLGTAALGAIGR